MTRIFFFLLAVGMTFTACQSDTNNNDTTTVPKAEPSEAPAKSMTKAAENTARPSTTDRLLKLANGNAEATKAAETIGSLIGSNMISAIDFKNGLLTLNYFESADDYNAIVANKSQKMNEGTFAQYWNTGSRAEKTFCSAAAEVLRKHDSVTSVKVVLPIGKQQMKGQIDRAGLSEVTGKSWKELVADWDVQFTNGIVRIPEGRAKFMKAFMD